MQGRLSLSAFLAFALLLILASPASAFEQKLLADDGAATDQLGASVAIDGDTAVVGAPFADVNGHADQGAVYVYTLDNDTWTQSAKLTVSDGAANALLGWSVAIDGNTIVAGAINYSVGGNGRGAVYTFARTGDADRTETAKLTASDGITNDNLGASVAIDGDQIVAGAQGADDNTSVINEGAVYTFTRSGVNRTQTAKLTATDRLSSSDSLGQSVAIDGDVIVAGAPGNDTSFDPTGHNVGALYTFDATATGNRNPTAKLTASGGAENDYLGTSVDIDDDVIVAGAPVDSPGIGTGAVYTFAADGNSPRSQTAKLTASDGANGDHLGTSVAISGDVIVAGAYGDDSFRGSVYEFDRTGSSPRSQTAKLTDPGGEGGDWFGYSLASDTGEILAGAPNDDVGSESTQGSAYFAGSLEGANLSLTMGDDPDPVTVGDTVTYTLDAHNAGPEDAKMVQITDTLPDGVTYEAGDSDPSCTQMTSGSGEHIVTCDVGDLDSGDDSSLSIVVTTHEVGTIHNTAKIESTDTDPDAPMDPNESNNTATASTLVRKKPTISIGDTSVQETQSGQVDAVFRVSLSGQSSHQVSVDYRTKDGSAKSLSDYDATSGTLSFAPGTTQQSVTVKVNGDTDDEPAEVFFVTLSGASEATIGDGSGTGTIEDATKPDTTDPDVDIKKISVHGDDAKVKFKASDDETDKQDLDVECKLDKKKWKDCDSPDKFKNLDKGKHKVSVRATDEADNDDTDSEKFKVKH